MSYKKELGTVAHTCNPSYLGNGDQEDGDSKPDWAKVSKSPFQPTNQAWGHTPVISAIQEV
jgi:hypothetical protein